MKLPPTQELAFVQCTVLRKCSIIVSYHLATNLLVYANGFLTGHASYSGWDVFLVGDAIGTLAAESCGRTKHLPFAPRRVCHICFSVLLIGMLGVDPSAFLESVLKASKFVLERIDLNCFHNPQ